MYKCTLNIAIYSNDDSIFNILTTIHPLDKFEHIIKKYDKITEAKLENKDIIIFDIPFTPSDINDWHTRKKADALLIVCADSTSMKSLTSEEFNIIDDIWAKPFRDNLISFYFKKLQNQIKQTKDFKLTQNYLDTTIDSLPDLIWYKDIRGAHLKVNQSFCNTVGKTKEDIAGRGHYYIWGLEPEEYEKGEYVCLETDEIVLREKKTSLFDEKVKCINEMRQFKTYKSPIFDDSGEIIGTVGIARDVTDLTNIQIELDILIQNMPFAILITDKNRVILNANSRYLNLFSLNKADIIGISLNTLSEKYIDIIQKEHWKIQRTNRGIYLHGHNKIFKIQKEKLIDIFGEISGYIFLHIDVTFEDNYENKLLQAANTDFLTQLNNRRSLNDFLAQKPNLHQTALMLIDLDDFKNINDQYGHAEGDHLLVDFSKILLNIFPSNNIFRLGGDEFLIIFTDIIQQSAIQEAAQTVIDQFQAKISQSDVLEKVSVSIGIVINTDNLSDFNDLFKRADVALYHSKHLGKSRYSLWNKMIIS